ncbi:MAG: response regulator, partial [Bdellovibrionota bacterium]
MPQQTKKLVLVVDDDRDIREAVSTALSEAGYPVLCAAHGEAALEILRASPQAASLILLDLMMPVMDGWEFRAIQKEDPAIQNIPVMILTAGGRVEKKAQNLEAVGWLRKPFGLEVLLREVESVLAKSSSAEAAL